MVKVWIGNGNGKAVKVAGADTSPSGRYEITNRGIPHTSSDSGVFEFDASNDPFHRYEITRQDSFTIDRISISSDRKMKYVVRFAEPIEVNGKRISGVKLGKKELAYLAPESTDSSRRVGDMYCLDQDRLMELVKKHAPR